MRLRTGIGAWLLAVSLQAPALEMPDDASGPTCEHYMPMGGLAWQHRGGDWVDAAGVPFGSQPLDSMVVNESATPVTMTLDVSGAVRRAAARGRHSITLMLRAHPGSSAQADFYSREHTFVEQRPMLLVTRADRGTARVAVAADTYLDCTSAYSLGSEAAVSVSANRSTLLRFVLPAGPMATARLQLTSWRQIAGSLRVDAFEAAIPYEQEATPPRRGLASGFGLDEGIQRHPDVYFASGFDEWSWPLTWRDATVRSHADVVSSDAEQHFSPLVGPALRVRIPSGQQLGLDLRYHFSRHGQQEPEEAYLRYYLRFGSDWDPQADGGKLPGLAGTYGRAGWGDRVSNGSNGWSMRAAFAQRQRTRSTEGLTALGTLACHGRVADASCETWGWALSGGALLQNERWYCIEQRVKLNTPGKPDGIFEAWIDGRLVASHHNVLYRDTPQLRIETAWMDVYHGGTKPAATDMTLFIDAVVVARSYIGPIAGVIPPVDPAARAVRR